MERQTALISNYLRHHNKPTFRHFIKANEKKIEDVSVKLLSNDTAIQLERGWAKAYNNITIIIRPGKPLAETIRQTSANFKYIHQVVTAKKKRTTKRLHPARTKT
ncbi:hypothetical protein PS15p_208879 [Mucor circinelloides]